MSRSRMRQHVEGPGHMKLLDRMRTRARRVVIKSPSPMVCLNCGQPSTYLTQFLGLEVTFELKIVEFSDE